MRFKTTFLLALSLMLTATTLSANVPQLINYQCVISDSIGDPLTQNNVSVRFLMYTDSTAGAIVWLSITEKDVVNGLYQHNLGSVSSFSDTLFSAFSELWLEVLIDGESIEPRTRVVAAPYAIRSDKVCTVDGAETGVIRADSAGESSAPLVIHGQSIALQNGKRLLSLYHENTLEPDLNDGFSAQIEFSIGTTDEGEMPIARITASRKNADNSGALIFKTSENGVFSDNQLYIDRNGKVGINTDDPDEALHIVAYSIGAGQPRDVLVLNHRREGAATLSNGFACGIQFSVGHDNDPVIDIGTIRAVRDGADNAGRMDFRVRNGGATITAMSIKPNGRIGIGTTTPSQELHVVGDICATGSIGACSDVRYKKNINPMMSSLSFVTQLRGVTYQWRQDEYPEHKFDDVTHIGFIAQEIEEFFPEVVRTDDDGYKTVDYGRLTPALVEAIKEQQKQIQSQQKQIEELKSIVNNFVSSSQSKVTISKR